MIFVQLNLNIMIQLQIVNSTVAADIMFLDATASIDHQDSKLYHMQLFISEVLSDDDG